LSKDILNPDVDDATALALCSHLADLGMLEKSGEEGWKLGLPLEGTFEIEDELKKLLRDICGTKKGFAVCYFLKDPPSPQIINDSLDRDPLRKTDNLKSNPQLLDQKTSNLSNLQLVKKYGRQVQSFVELEKRYTERLLGPNTTSKQARRIFNFILSRMKQKTEPRPWEQLSRRRHK
jgi:hypothetical protein